MGLVFLAVILNTLDNITTYFCLRAPVPMYEVFEANPLADFLFQTMGLRTGLIFEFVVSTLLLVWIACTKRIPHRVKVGFLVVLCALPGWAVWNNLRVMQEVGILN